MLKVKARTNKRVEIVIKNIYFAFSVVVLGGELLFKSKLLIFIGFAPFRFI